MKTYLLVFAMLFASVAEAQNTYKFIIRNDVTKQPLPGVTVSIPQLKNGNASDSTGNVVLQNIPNGKYEVKFSCIGYLPKDRAITLPQQGQNNVLEIFLEPLAGELAEVIVQTTRTDQNLSDIPTRVEALPLEELDEKGTMRPGDIKMLLGEATGVHVQATSAVSGTANFRIQGLDSRYTQLLKDGMPLYQGFSGGLSLVQISPLDLKQVEFIKGSASTLYGGGAIAGLINLISKTPQAKPELTFLLNTTTAKGKDASAFYSQKWAHVGTTIFSSYNYNKAYDPSSTGFSAIPNINRFTISPKIFFYPDKNNIGWLAFNTTYEDRLGGDMHVINGSPDAGHQYFEHNLSYRFSTQLSFTHTIDSIRKISVKNTVGYFNRRLSLPAFSFKGAQVSSYTEINYLQQTKKNSLVLGANLWTDKLSVTDNQALNYHLNTYGFFAQDTYKAASWLAIESGIRLDDTSPFPANNPSGLFLLPRLNILFIISDHWSSRIGGGLGYKMPVLFSDDNDADDYRNVQPLNISATKAERSYGTNADINFKSVIGDAFVNINQLFFYTRVNDPLIRQSNMLVNGVGYLSTQGVETNVKFFVDDLGIYLGYTYTDARQHFNGNNAAQPLTPKNQLNVDATYEIEGLFRAGVEGFYTGQQALANGNMAGDTGLLAY